MKKKGNMGRDYILIFMTDYKDVAIYDFNLPTTSMFPLGRNSAG